VYVCLCVCQAAITRRINLGGEGNVLYPVQSSLYWGFQRIRGFLNGMRYIKPRSTYLLTYCRFTFQRAFAAEQRLKVQQQQQQQEQKAAVGQISRS